MKKGICLAFTVLILVFASALPAHARDGHERGHGGFVFRGGVWIGPWGPWWGPPYYPYYPYYPEPPVQEQPPVYVQPPAQSEEEQYYWYYCTNPQGYYPYVKECPNGWMKVVPSPVPSNPGPRE